MNGLVDTDRVLRMFSEDRAASKKLYREFMGDGFAIKREDVYGTVEQRVLGSEEFLDNVMEQYEVEFKNNKREREYTLTKISEGVEKIKGVTLKQIRGQSKFARISTGRKLLILVAKEYGYKGKEIAEYIKRDPAIISIALKDRSRFEEEMGRVIGILKKLNI
jgi:hypothetical protein